jgi:hypothetical protein
LSRHHQTATSHDTFTSNRQTPVCSTRNFVRGRLCFGTLFAPAFFCSHPRSSSYSASTTTTMPDQTQRAPFSTTSPYNSTPSSSPYARRTTQHAPRTTPPSSTFFSSPPDDAHEMQPIPDAERHFGSSSSFRRHPSLSGPMADLESIRSAVTEQGPSGVWDRLVGLVKGVKHGGSPEQNGYELAPKAVEQTPSAKYASQTVEVRLFFVP